ncbi:unnamed protein product, partial [Laminaria digitata]
QEFAAGGKTARSGGAPEVEVSAAAAGAVAAELELPAELTARQRALAHETAERLGLGHASRGEGLLRVLVLSRGSCNWVAAAARAVAATERSTGDTPDENGQEFDATAAANPFAALLEGGKPRGDDSDDSHEPDEPDIPGETSEAGGGGGGSTRGERGRELPTSPPPSAAAAATEEEAQAAAASVSVSPTSGSTAVAKNASPSHRAEPKAQHAEVATGGLSLMSSSSAREDLPSSAREDDDSSS